MRTNLRALVLPLPILAAAFYACGGSTSSDNGGSGNDAGNGADSTANDAASDSSANDGGNTKDQSSPPNGAGVLAISKIFMGDTDRNGTANANAWKDFGTNIDGKITDRTSTDVCTLTAGAPKSAQADGTNGIDNAWGANILPIILTTAGSGASQQMNDAIANGAFTTMVRLDTLTADPNQASVPGSLYAGAKTENPPKWDGTDLWPIDTASVIGGDSNKPKVVFDQGAMAARVWTSAPAVTIDLPLSYGGANWNIPLLQARLSMQIANDGTSATLGTISGVIDTEKYIAALKKIAGRISTSLCNGSAFDSIAQQIRQAQDIRLDGTNSAGVPCNAISFGWGFEAKRVKLGSVVTPPPPPPDPCGDGG